MNGYMMFGRTLVVQRVPEDQVPDELFKGADQPFHVIPWAKLHRQRMNADPDPTDESAGKRQNKRVARLLKNEQKKREQLDALGIDYTFSGYQGSVPAQPQRVLLDE